MSIAARVSVSPFEQHYKEWFSRAFIQATSASAGVASEWNRDDIFGVDVVLRDGGISVDVQLKSTSSPILLADGTLSFPLEADTYNLLRATDRLAPAYLVVAILETDRRGWVRHAAGSTSILQEARWARLTGLAESPNATSVNVHLPVANVLTARAVRTFLDDARGDL